MTVACFQCLTVPFDSDILEREGRGLADKKIAVQLDFDGTVTEEDVSFLLLDTYVGSIWREYLKDYTSGKIPVGAFNRRVFGMMKADRRTMTDLVLGSERVRIRPGFKELIDYCSRQGYRTVIVSNGLEFYIQAILEKLGISNVEVHAAENEFDASGHEGQVSRPGRRRAGSRLQRGLYRAPPERGLRGHLYRQRRLGYPLCAAITACLRHGRVLERCQQEGLACLPFNDFFDVIRGLEKLEVAGA